MIFDNRSELLDGLPASMSRADDLIESAEFNPSSGARRQNSPLGFWQNIGAWPQHIVLNVAHYFGGGSEQYGDESDGGLIPLRAELFSAEQMEQHGKALAATHRLTRFGKHNRLLKRLDENEDVLIASCNLLMDAVKDKSPIAPAGEWLLDNFYLIQGQIRTARKHLPKGYSRELPRLASGDSRGLPRVYDLAVEVIAHGDGRVDAALLKAFVSAYQTITPLTLGELWAIPIMLRLAVIENLRGVAARITAARTHVNQAQYWADKMIRAAEDDPKSLILVIADMARSNQILVSSFVAELARRLQGHSSALALPLTWVKDRLAESSQTIEQMILLETQQQAADQVSISNSIGSLRFLDATDWRIFLESISVVEQLLRSDEVYRKMDFATRDSYRQVIDRLAKRVRLTETQVTEAAFELAAAAAVGVPEQPHKSHIGYYLVDDGLTQLEQVVKPRLPLATKIRRFFGRAPLLLHVGGAVALTAIFTSVVVLEARSMGVVGWPLWLLGCFAVLATSQLAAALTNWFAILLVNPKLLPRMDFSKGLPPAMGTLVVIPTMLGCSGDIDDLLEALEVRFLGNQDDYLHFGLLTDFFDAKSQTLPNDEQLVRHVQAGIRGLNEKYPSPNSDRFYLFHRSRNWNATEKMWMGYERKRGKLADLNAVLRGEIGSGHSAGFAVIEGDIGQLNHVQYVITLDTDTQLPRDSAREFVGVMAHPLNRPRFDSAGSRVVGGYGILQPRMAASLSGKKHSRYALLYGLEAGIDPYTRSVSDVYQDLFDEGSFIGKGIYDVDAFEHALKGRFPDNRILSHDLLEGCYARSGLLSDVQLYEENPTTYASDVGRRERWIRGDWQIASWLFWRVPGFARKQHPNPLSALSRWKIFDNLVRSLAPGAMLALLILGWVSSNATGFWTLVVVAIVLIPSLSIAFVDLFRPPKEVVYLQHGMAVAQSAWRNIVQGLFRVACLAHEAVYSLEAILRSIGRLVFTRRLLLEWNTYADQSKRGPVTLGATFRHMWTAVALALAVAVTLGVFNPLALLKAAPVILLWLGSPLLAWWVSQPLRVQAIELAPEQVIYLRKMARKTWAFFERFVSAEDNWLPPDNYQERPGPITAHRTSPTNMGLALLANLTAYDFAYLPCGQMLERIANTLHTMMKMERYQGHFLNWYETRTLRPLPPRYVSSVDSGNLVGHLMTLRAALVAQPDQAIVGTHIFAGLLDTARLLLDAATADHADILRPSIVSLQNTLAAAEAQYPVRLSTIAQYLEPLAFSSQAFLHQLDVTGDSELLLWATALAEQANSHWLELVQLAPWLRLVGLPDHLKPTDFDDIPNLRRLSMAPDTWLREIEKEEASVSPVDKIWLDKLRTAITSGGEHANERIAFINTLLLQITELCQVDYEFLYDRSRHLLAVGYNVDEFRRDTSFYDLLASEARLGNFVAIAQGQLPQESWFALGRLRTAVGNDHSLVSWSGSMFEYLMPNLVMPSFDSTLLDQTCRAAVARQIVYGEQRSVPWGISESGYNALDAGSNYQYHAFGVPGLGLQRGLGEDLVVAPYATALALMFAPQEACANLQRLSAMGMEGPYGFFEALDYTPTRVSRGQTNAIVYSYMAHHQGMSLLSFAYVLLGQPMQKRFQSDPQFQATLLLLQERIPKTSVFYNHVAEHARGIPFTSSEDISVHTPIKAETKIPEVHLLSNGRYHVMVTNAGGGYSRWKDLAVTRWREDTTCDNWGSFIYLRDLETHEVWSTTHQPTLKRADTYEALFSEWRAEYRRRDFGIETYSEIVVSPEDDVELRRVRVTNRSRRSRIIELTSYSEVVLAAQAADTMQTTFGNLFVQSEILEDRHAILLNRRPRSTGDEAIWMFHLLAVNGPNMANISYETDRMKFMGRGNTLTSPLAMSDTQPLSGSKGSVLDPVASIRCFITLEAEQSITLDFVWGVADSRAATVALVERYQDRQFADRVFDLATTHGGVILRQINATEADASLYRKLARSVLFANPALRAEPQILAQNRRGQSGLWSYAISGDLPIVLLKIASADNIHLVSQLIQCHAYWRLKGLIVDLVIWNEDHSGYRQLLHNQIMGLIATSIDAQSIDRPGGIFVRSADQISSEDGILLQTVARAIIIDSRGSLAEQINRRSLADSKVPRLFVSRTYRPEIPAPVFKAKAPTLLNNDLGGFSEEGREYVITLGDSQTTPLPWVNVLANPNFGTVVTESGLSYTWSENAHEFRLTPWSDDPVGAAGGEAIYLRDEASGYIWSPTPLPKPSPVPKLTPYTVRHGFGYTVFEHSEGGIYSELWVYVDAVEAVKFSVLKVRNDSGRPRQLSATGYVEWVLGDLRAKSAMHLVTEIDSASGAMFARNAYNTEFAGRVGFFDVDDLSRTLSGDRAEFLGRNGSIHHPDALTRAQLSGRLGAALDPCGAIQVPFKLADGQTREIIFRLGAGRDIEQTRALVQRLRVVGTARTALQRVRDFWQQTITSVQVHTPDPAVNLLANGWLLYQTLGCRIWARSGFYQSGGAFGFRDQLQDSMALFHSRPQLVREHLLRCAQRQYPAGDVQHWWHPPSGRGVRTRCSDDYLWLPFVTCHYIQNTGDVGVLEEVMPYLQGRELAVDEESYYDLPGHSAEAGSLYQHCVRAIENGLSFGEHGIPLMQSGDWNDGMNLVGIHGKGESVWLGFFLYDVLTSFANIAEQHNDAAFATRCLTEADTLRQNIEKNAWDGEWYRRAYFDDGTPLGSAQNTECRIDSISQSWSVLSGAGSQERTLTAMDSLYQHLVRKDSGIIQLLDPPFDTAPMNPGYIKGYVPGVRENGGQYTHAAVWAAMAFAAVGDKARAWELLTLINPINHTSSAQDVAVYKGEPYVVAADVYAIAPHTGRGGWTWYTGSAGLTYRLIMESILGLKRRGNRLFLAPCVPREWPSFTLDYRFGETLYHLTVTQAQTGASANSEFKRCIYTLDGVERQEDFIELVDDKHYHHWQIAYLAS